ncbi:unnamed protein product [Peronospora belbahrii]|nr:unnamed protein product [Peronospora belbahrii]
MARNNDRGSRNDLKTWQWGLIGLAIVLGIGMLLFVFNFIKNRPQRGDNRREVIQTLDSRHPQPVNDVNSLPTVSCKSKVAARGTTGSQNTNSFQMPDFSDGSYRTHAMNLMSSTLTDTDIVTEQQERVFSPISASSLSARSSLYSQGVDTSTMLNTACLLEVSHVRGNISESGRPPYPSLSSYSTPSDIESLSSQITIDDSDIETGERLSCPRKKSIEF